MTDFGWGAYMNLKKKMERFLGEDIEKEPSRKGKKSRALDIQDEKKQAKIRDLEEKLNEKEKELDKIEDLLINTQKQEKENYETNKKALDGMVVMIKDLMGKEQEEQDRIAKSKKSLKKELNIDEMEKALQEQYEELEFD